ncbi:ABC-type antimicrobial peptide transport system, ATPase component [hydrothermal vent metagenome]|uniref:ABC-type antimicrobial peptide transport system, ATPase component n=1 Tax=hydrothermal vent metagenome TaxID=652676 RepID=A0A3B0UIY7_9ZZZZ
MFDNEFIVHELTDDDKWRLFMKNHLSNRRHRQQQTASSASLSTAVSHSGNLIDMRGVIKTYETAAGSFTAIENIDLQIEAGKFVAIVGKSGSGKSTLLNMLTGIDRPTDGEVVINGTAVTTLSEDQIATWRGRNVGVVFQFFQLMPTLTVIENVMMPMDFCNVYTPRERRKRALALLEQVDVADQADKFPAKLSGGQQQRVAIARALANDPPILVADEPTGNLDSRTADDVLTLFQKLADGGKTVIMVTHERDVASWVSRVVTLVDGRVVAEEQGRFFTPAPLHPISPAQEEEADHA